MASGLMIDYPIEQFQLANGLRLVVNQDLHSPGADINLWYRVGSADESPGMFGFAHLFEHLMFEGSAQVGANEHMSLIQSVGGSCNATTSFDRTNYFETVPTGALELALWLEADRMASLNVSQEKLDNQREVVKEEKRQRYDNVAYGDMLFEILKLNFADHHPYAHPTIGSMDELDNASLKMVTDFFKTWYRPDNAVLSVVCPLPPEKVYELVEKHFGQIGVLANSQSSGIKPGYGSAVGAGVKNSPVSPADLIRLAGIGSGSRTAVVKRKVPADVVNLCWLVPGITSEASLALSQGLSVLTRGLSSRLYRNLVRENKTAQYVSAYDLGLARSVSLVVISAECSPGVCSEMLREQIFATLQQIKVEGVTEAEAERALVNYESGTLADLSNRSERANQLSAYASIFNDPQVLIDELEKVNAITSSQISEAICYWLAPELANCLYYETEDNCAR